MITSPSWSSKKATLYFTPSDQTFLQFSPLEAWNYGKDLWVNEGWHNPFFARRIYASRCRKNVITQDKFLVISPYIIKLSDNIQQEIYKGANENLANIETGNDSLQAPLQVPIFLSR